MADVSVVIPCYNGEPYIAETLESVLAQSEPVREVIVIDDGSKDGSAAVVEGYVEKTAGRVVLIRQDNAGESRARNVGIQRAAGAYIGFLDADDLWMPDKVKLQVEALAGHPEAVGVHARVFNFSKTLDDAGRAETEKTKDAPSVEELIQYHWIAPSSLMVRREVLMDRGIRFEEAIRHAEDMLFIADLRLAGPLRLVDQPLVAKRVHVQQQSRNPWHTIRSGESRTQWVRSRKAKLELADKLDAWLAEVMVGTLEDRYWRRTFEGYEDARNRVRALHPGWLARSKVANRRIWPAWLYRVADALRPR
jgi:glycosyltransferase involved in cell wall biosynthesis